MKWVDREEAGEGMRSEAQERKKLDSHYQGLVGVPQQQPQGHGWLCIAAHSHQGSQARKTPRLHYTLAAGTT
jgi:hypothetical protein